MKPTTIKDIAKQLDIHHSTVSRALKDHPDVAPKTQQLVLKAAQELNYTPNAAAAALRSANPSGILVTIPLGAETLLKGFAGNIADRVRDLSWPTPTVVLGNETAIPLKPAKRIIISFDDAVNEQTLLSATEPGVKTVVIHFDLNQQMREAVTHLVSTDRRSLGLVCSQRLGNIRQKAFQEILLERFLPVRSQHVTMVDGDRWEPALFRTAFSNYDAPNGIVVSSANAALVLWRCLDADGIDAQLVCLESDPALAHLAPNIHCVDFAISKALDDAFSWLAHDDEGEGSCHWIDVDFL